MTKDVGKEIQDTLGIPWAPAAWLELSSDGAMAGFLWARVQPVVASGAFWRESLALLSVAFHDLSNDYGPGKGVMLPEADRRGILFDLDTLLYGSGQLMLLHAVLSQAVREGVSGRRGLAEGNRPRSGYRRRPLESVEDEAAPSDVQRLFREVRDALELSGVPLDVRALAKWMGFLETSWARFKAWRRRPAYLDARDDLQRRAEAAVKRLSPQVVIDSQELVRAAGDPKRAEMARTWVQRQALGYGPRILLDAFFRIEAAVHPELGARISDDDRSSRA